MTAIYTLPMQRDVAAFHDAFGTPNLIATPGPLPLDRAPLRCSLIREEGVVELRDAVEANDPVAIIDAQIDTLYVSLGALVEMGQDVGTSVLVYDGKRHAFDFAKLVAMAGAGAAANDMLLSLLDQAFRRQDADRSVEILSSIAASAITNLVFAGVDPQPFFDEVQRANMSKLGADGKPVISRGQAIDGFPKGKILKGANYVAPDLASIYDRLYVRPLEVTVSSEFERGARAAAEAMRLQLVESPRVPDTGEVSARLKALESKAVDAAIRVEQVRVARTAA